MSDDGRGNVGLWALIALVAVGGLAQVDRWVLAMAGVVVVLAAVAAVVHLTQRAPWSTATGLGRSQALASWEAYLARMGQHGPRPADVVAGLCRVVAVADDPGHDMPVALLEPPRIDDRGLATTWRHHFLLLHCYNAARGRDGSFEPLLLPVDRTSRDPIAAAAATYGVAPATYRALQRRT